MQAAFRISMRHSQVACCLEGNTLLHTYCFSFWKQASKFFDVEFD